MGCDLCPRQCKTNRTVGEPLGFCRSTNTAVITRAAPHFWEEPCISGTKGSGTVFFAGCNLGCVYCQNHAISRDGTKGQPVDHRALQRVYAGLKAQGVHNINLVTPTHFIPVIARSLDPSPGLPVVYNSSGYESVSGLKQLEGKVQIYLPDMKYAQSQPAAEYSHAPDYPQTAKAAILEMFRQVGPCRMNEQGILEKGVLIRHLILPGHTKNTLAVIQWVADTFAPGEVLFSLMGQYTPTPAVKDHPNLRRPITKREYEKCVDAMWEAGLTQGFVQELTSAHTRFIPDFDQTGCNT